MSAKVSDGSQPQNTPRDCLAQKPPIRIPRLNKGKAQQTVRKIKRSSASSGGTRQDMASDGRVLISRS